MLEKGVVGRWKSNVVLCRPWKQLLSTLWTIIVVVAGGCEDVNYRNEIWTLVTVLNTMRARFVHQDDHFLRFSNSVMSFNLKCSLAIQICDVFLFTVTLTISHHP